AQAGTPGAVRRRARRAMSGPRPPSSHPTHLPDPVAAVSSLACSPLARVGAADGVQFPHQRSDPVTPSAGSGGSAVRPGPGQGTGGKVGVVGDVPGRAVVPDGPDVARGA